MSLLMDALKRAEEAKRQNQTSSASPAGTDVAVELSLDGTDNRERAKVDVAAPLDFVLEPEKKAANTHQSLPDIPEKLELLDSQFLDSVPPPQPSTPRPSISNPPPVPQEGPTGTSAPAKPLSPAQQAAKTVFEVKQQPRDNKTFLISIGIFSLLAITSIGIYFWLQLQPRTGLLALKQTPSSAPAQAAAAAPLIPSSPAIGAPNLPVPSSAPPGATALPELTDDTTQVMPAPVETKPRLADFGRGRKRSALEELSGGASGGIRFRSSQPGIDPALMRGYEAYQAGDYAAARAAYDQALRNDPNNLDALHGLGALALQAKQAEEAEYYFQRSLAVEPRDPIARAGLTAVRNESDPVNAESRLRTLLADQPNSPHLNFALGNLLASGSRWAEAQQAYFRAMSADPDNPDVLFNLAVSLDHLHQDRIAVDYYRKAIAAASRLPHQFDPGRAAERIKAIQP